MFTALRGPQFYLYLILLVEKVLDFLLILSLLKKVLTQFTINIGIKHDFPFITEGVITNTCPYNIQRTFSALKIEYF